VKTKPILSLIILLTGLLTLSGCGAVSDFFTTETPPAFEATPTTAPTATPGALGVDAPITLKIWLPPEFDPTSETDAGAILQTRLEEYSQLHPGVRVETRIKSTTGPASLIDSLSGASSAAPLALPDLVLLSTSDVEIAFERNLVFPLQMEIDFSPESDWYQFASGLAGDAHFWGIPFAADGLVMVFRPSQTENPSTSWNEFLDAGERLIFPAAEPQSLMTSLLYLSEQEQAANLEDLSIDAGSLENVFQFYQQAQARNLMPYWLTQLESDQMVWDSYLEGQAELAVTWMSRYLQQAPDHISAAMIPTRSGTPYTLTTGWVWSVATPAAERQEAAEDLALFLTEAAFSGSWTQAAGYLPVRPSGLAGWEAGPDQSLASIILPAAIPAPSHTTLSIVGPAFQQAATGILKQELTVSQAAEAVINQVVNEGN
jgi:ABC-type glycerol-3-phosphate transport system substrate-binding protein